MLPPPREPETKTKDARWKSNTVFHTWPVACWPHKKTQLFHRLPAGRNKTGTVHENTKLKFVAGWPTNKLTHQTQSKTKNHKKDGGTRVRVFSQPCRTRSAFSVSVAPPFFSVSPTLLAALPDPV
jgi:hypothetical protein